MMKFAGNAVWIVLGGLGLAACNSTGSSVPPPGVPEMQVAFRWCSGSPEFAIGSIPAGTKSLDLRMVDHQAPAYRHGGGTVPHDGKNSAKIPCGALGGTYVGPSPPPPQIHDYEWTVTAHDASGKALAVGHATRKFPE